MHVSMANSRHSTEGKHGTLLRLGEDNSTVSWGGSIEAIQPTGTLRDGCEARLRIGLLTNRKRTVLGIKRKGGEIHAAACPHDFWDGHED